MIIAGAGGHGLEVAAVLGTVLDSSYFPMFFDQDPALHSKFQEEQLISEKEILQKVLEKNPSFCLGVGNPLHREKLDELLSEAGGKLVGIIASSSVIQSELSHVDVLSFGFVGPKVSLGRGVLVNTRAHIHHESIIGDYTEIGPGALILGQVKVGKKCRIGAGAILLPGIHIADEVIVGAGAVVTKDITYGQVVIGVPARSTPKSEKEKSD